MKKTLTIVLAVMAVASLLFGMKQEGANARLTTNKEVVLVAGQNVIMPQSLLEQQKTVTLHERYHDTDGIVPVKVEGSSNEQNTRDCSGGDCWNLQHIGDDTQWYLGSGAAGDTFAIAFQAAVPCIVQEAYIKWFDGGNVTAFGAMISDAAVAATNGTGASVIAAQGIEWGRGTANFSPIGTLMTNPTPNTIDGAVQDWTFQMDIGGEFQVGDENDLSDNPPFAIIFVKGSETPHPLAADVFTGESYNWFCGPWTDPDGDIYTPDGAFNDGYGWGNYQSSPIAGGLIDIAVQVRVTYPWGAPIAANPGQLCNTYATTDTRTITVDLFDDVEEGFGIDGNDVVEFHWAVDDVEEIPMFLDEATPLDVGADGNGVYGFDITYNVTAGSEITYWFVMTDNNGLESSTYPMGFSVVAPQNPDADLLFIADHSHQYYLNQYEDVANALGYNFEVWSTLDNAGIHTSVINHGWTNIIVYGWGNATVPIVAGEEDPGYGEFLANGGDLLIADQDWFYGHALDGYPTPLAFGPGDPAYDWFGLAGGMSDPDDDEDSANGGAGDTLLTSLVEGLTDLQLFNGKYGTLNWSDFLYPDIATSIYQGQDTEEIVGTMLEVGDRGSKRVCLSFTADAAVDTTELGEVFYLPEFAEYVAYFLTLFDVASPPQAIITDGPEGVIYNDAGQDVYAEINDVNGDEFVAMLYWSVDGGAPESIAMVATERAEYMASIPMQAGGSNVEYWVEATDDDGTAASASGTYYVFAPTSEVLFVLNNEMDPGEYPGLYYFYDANDTGDLWIWPDFWTGEVNADLLSFYDIVFEITSTATWADFYDHYDVIAAWLAEGNKSYFLGGDEYLGMLYDWANMSFTEGDFWYDMGILNLYNDIAGVDPTPLNAVGNQLISAKLADAVEALGDGSYLQYDPAFEIGLTNWMDGFDPAPGAVPFITDDATGYAVALWKEWDNGNKTVILGVDPLALNSAPNYVWWGATLEGPSKMALDWFMGECLNSLGDVNMDTGKDILDVVMLVGHILGTVTLEDCQLWGANLNGDGNIDILDIVMLVDQILNGRMEPATSASLMVTPESVSLIADGFVGGVQIEITHDSDFVLELSGNAMVADYVTTGNTTTLIAVAPEGEIFTAAGSFEITSVIAATTNGYINVGINAPTEFSLSAAYPNPFNPVTSLQLSIPETGMVRVNVFNVVGQQVATLVNGNMEAGYHTISWNAATVPSGMYMIRAEVGANVETQKVMLLK